MLWQKNWQSKLQQLEDNRAWDDAIEFMIQVLKNDSNNKEAYLRMLYLLMNLRVEEPHDKNKNPYYEELMLKYFNESYQRFNNDAEYLFYTGTIAFISVWFFGIESEDAEAMIEKAKQLDPANPIYNWLCLYSPANKITESMKEYARFVLQEDSPIQKALRLKGSLGNYFLDILIPWCKEILNQ